MVDNVRSVNDKPLWCNGSIKPIGLSIKDFTLSLILISSIATFVLVHFITVSVNFDNSSDIVTSLVCIAITVYVFICELGIETKKHIFDSDFVDNITSVIRYLVFSTAFVSVLYMFFKDSVALFILSVAFSCIVICLSLFFEHFIILGVEYYTNILINVKCEKNRNDESEDYNCILDYLNVHAADITCIEHLIKDIFKEQMPIDSEDEVRIIVDKINKNVCCEESLSSSNRDEIEALIKDFYWISCIRMNIIGIKENGNQFWSKYSKKLNDYYIRTAEIDYKQIKRLLSNSAMVL